ncbi:MAG: hypothetical protein KDD53_11605, partial [Bdellovibrionales bacterium]|nr:hypothetical protein [Bdellovibrionales bacterium]
MIFAAAGEFMAAFQLFAADQLAQYKGMAVFGSARLKAESPLFERIVALVAHLATRFNFDVVTGGGPGVMYAGNQGGHRAKGAGARIRVKTSKIRIPAEPLHGEYDLSMEFPWFEPRVRAFLCMA